jgi:hypothetical protein
MRQIQSSHERGGLMKERDQIPVIVSEADLVLGQDAVVERSLSAQLDSSDSGAKARSFRDLRGTAEAVPFHGAPNIYERNLGRIRRPLLRCALLFETFWRNLASS